MNCVDCFTRYSWAKCSNQMYKCDTDKQLRPTAFFKRHIYAMLTPRKTDIKWICQSYCSHNVKTRVAAILIWKKCSFYFKVMTSKQLCFCQPHIIQKLHNSCICLQYTPNWDGHNFESFFTAVRQLCDYMGLAQDQLCLSIHCTFSHILFLREKLFPMTLSNKCFPKMVLDDATVILDLH